MSSFGLYLASVSTPIAQRVLTGLGFGAVTYVGLDAIQSQVQNAITSNWGAVPATAAQLLTLSGMPEGVGIVLGALACRFSMLQLKAIQKII